MTKPLRLQRTHSGSNGHMNGDFGRNHYIKFQ